MCHPLRTLVLTIAFGTWANIGYTQAPAVNVDAEAIYFSHSYADNLERDTVSLVIKGLWLPYYTGWLVDKEINTQNDTLRVKLCYWSYSNSMSGSQTTDTIQMGVFTQGVYSVQLIINITTSAQYDSCNHTNIRDTLDMAFPVFSATGITSIGHPSSVIRLYPNPSNGNVTLSVDERLIGSTATISDITGRVVAAVPLTTQYSPLSTLAFGSGIYFVTVGNRTQKLIIQY